MRAFFKNIDTFQVVGFILSAGVTLLVWVVTGGREPIASITLGFLLAVLTQGFDLQKRIKDSEERLMAAHGLSQELFRSKRLQGEIQHIVQDYLAVKGVWFDLFRNRADEAITDCRKVLHGMAEGKLEVNRSGGTPYSSGAYTIPKTKKLAKAVAAIDASYWRTPEGETYVRENVDAIGRRVRFIRVFVYPVATLRSMVDILQNHQAFGIEVYVAPPENLPKELVEDYLILDDRLLVSTDPSGQVQTLTIDKTEVEHAVKRFDTLLRHAKRLNDVIDALKVVS